MTDVSILDSTIQIFPDMPISVYGENDSFDFNKFLDELISIDSVYRSGINVNFYPFRKETQAVNDGDFEYLKTIVSNGSVFPFMTPAKDSNGNIVKDENGTISHYAVIYKLPDTWMCLYITAVQYQEIIDICHDTYATIRNTFLLGLYNHLVYNNLINGFSGDFEDPATLSYFIQRLNNSEYRYINFHNLGRITSDGDAVVCIICFSKEDREVYSDWINVYYVRELIAECMFRAIFTDTKCLEHYVDTYTAHPESGTESPESENNEQSEHSNSTPDSTVDMSLNSSIIEAILRENLNESSNQSSNEEMTTESTETSTPATEDPQVENIDARLLLSENSNTYLVDESTSRFSDAIWYQKIQQTNVMVAGLGGIGSWVAFFLARMKPHCIKIIDPDSVEMVNMAGQLFGEDHIGTSKVNAMSFIMSGYCNYYRYIGCQDMYNVVMHGTEDIMICGFDNMMARQCYFEAWKNHVLTKDETHRKECLFIDGRLNAEEFQIFCIRGDHAYHMKKYVEEWLFDDYKAEEATCSYKQTSFCANMIASYIVNLYVNHIANMCEVLIDRSLPFFTYYNAETMQLKMK